MQFMLCFVQNMVFAVDRFRNLFCAWPNNCAEQNGGAAAAAATTAVKTVCLHLIPCIQFNTHNILRSATTATNGSHQTSFLPDNIFLLFVVSTTSYSFVCCFVLVWLVFRSFGLQCNETSDLLCAGAACAHSLHNCASLHRLTVLRVQECAMQQWQRPI